MAALQSAYAATGCRVDYKVSNQWPGGFTAALAVTNLGDTVNGWSLDFAFPDANQKVSQGWNATWTQSGTAVKVTNPGWSPAIAGGGSVTAGFNGTFGSANPVPAKFQLNGTTCTGAVATATPSATVTASATPTRTATASPSTTVSPSATATASPTATTSPTATAGPTAADPWTPPSALAGPLAKVWKHQEETYSNLYGFKNYGWDQIMANGGSINYCVRWDSTERVTAAQRDAVHATLQKQYQKWMDQLTDWNAWPYRQVPVKVVGWAVRDRAQLEWTDDSVDIYVNGIREDAPQCGEPCGRFFHQDGNYSGCTGGKSHHYDHSLWLTKGWFDKWMLRDFWRHLKSRYQL